MANPDRRKNRWTNTAAGMWHRYAPNIGNCGPSGLRIGRTPSSVPNLGLMLHCHAQFVIPVMSTAADRSGQTDR